MILLLFVLQVILYEYIKLHKFEKSHREKFRKKKCCSNVDILGLKCRKQFINDIYFLIFRHLF